MHGRILPENSTAVGLGKEVRSIVSRASRDLAEGSGKGEIHHLPEALMAIRQTEKQNSVYHGESQ